MEAISSNTGHAWSDALLVKMAVEGKTFQQARKEVEEDQETNSPPSSSPPVSDSTPHASETFLQVDIQQVHAELKTDAFSLTYDRTSISVASRTTTRQPAPGQPQDPLLLDLDGNGPDTTGRAGALPFDLSGKGRTTLTSFVSGQDALLALDRNGNGRIDDGGELFGDQHGAADGFEELRRFDANGDAVIDLHDPVFASLQLLHGNGALTPLSTSGIQAIDLNATRQPTSQATGDVVWARSQASTAGTRGVSVYAMGLQTFDQWG